MSATQYQQDAVTACLAAFGEQNAYLVADEAGLGKTHIARGVVEKMWDSWKIGPRKLTPNFNVYYIGSNVELLENTINKLIGESDNYHHVADINRLSMFSITPHRLGPDKINLFSCSALLINAEKSPAGSDDERKQYYNNIQSTPLSTLQQAYADACKKNDTVLKNSFSVAIQINSTPTSFAPAATETLLKKSNCILRNLYNHLAFCSDKVAPVLIIADEFHRYDSIVTNALQSLIVYENNRRRKKDIPAVKLLLLSATPYNIYKDAWEHITEDNDFFDNQGKPYGNAALQDFPSLLAFLSGEISGTAQSSISELYNKFQQGTADAPSPKEMSDALKKYVYRNERTGEEAGKYCDLPTQAEFWGGEFEGCMQLPKNDDIKRYRSLCAGVCSFPEKPSNKKTDVYDAFPQRKKAATCLTKDDFIFNTDGKLKTDMLRQNLGLACIQKYNADNGKQLLWVPPTAPLYKPEGVFATHRHYSKLLVFSAYKMVPHFVSGIFSAYVGQPCNIAAPLSIAPLSIAPLAYPQTLGLLAAAYQPKFAPQKHYQDIIKELCNNKFFPLSEKMALYALASPEVCAYRLTKDVNKAKEIAEAFNTYFASEGIQQSLAQQDITTVTELLHYCAQGNLQAMMAEFAHCHGTGWEDAIIAALTLPASTVQAYHKNNYLCKEGALALPVHFAMPFESYRTKKDGANTKVHLETVRAAFNAPFWPMIVSTTSRGQEGFDFDRYSHRIMHYSLPNSPTSFEQRDGRVDRRLSLLTRKKMVEMHGETYAARYNERPSTQANPPKCLPEAFWDALLQEKTAQGHDGLSPLWCVKDYKGNLKQERIIPFFPYSKEHVAYKRLLHAKNKYRRAFGLPNEQIGNPKTTPLKLNDIK